MSWSELWNSSASIQSVKKMKTRTDKDNGLASRAYGRLLLPERLLHAFRIEAELKPTKKII